MKSFRKSASSTSRKAARASLTSVQISLRSEFGKNEAMLRGLDPTEALELATHCKGDKLRLKRWIKRRLSGELLPYVVGHFAFRGHTFEIDKRAYVTDPEASHLVSAVIARAEAESLLNESSLGLVESRVSTWQTTPHPHDRSEAHTHKSLTLTARRSARLKKDHLS